jgi:hypothetical protein
VYKTIPIGMKQVIKGMKQVVAGIKRLVGVWNRLSQVWNDMFWYETTLVYNDIPRYELISEGMKRTTAGMIFHTCVFEETLLSAVCDGQSQRHSRPGWHSLVTVRGSRDLTFCFFWTNVCLLLFFFPSNPCMHRYETFIFLYEIGSNW